MSYFKKKQFIALVAKLKMPGQPVQKPAAGRGMVPEIWAKKQERTGEPPFLRISMSVVLLSRGLRKTGTPFPQWVGS